MSEPVKITLEMMQNGQIEVHYAFFNFLFALGLLIASYAIQALIPKPKGEGPQKAGIGDFDFPQIEEGTPQPIVFGDVWTEDWVVGWFGNLRTSAIKSKGGKK